MIYDSNLLQRKIIKTDSEIGVLVISKPEILKSIHIENTIDQIIKNVFEGSEQRIDVLLTCMGLSREDSNRRDVNIDRDILLESTTSKNWYDLIKSLLNVWEFIFLYGAIETTFKRILLKEGSVREEDLLGEIFDKFDGLSDHLDFKKVDIECIWFFYTELRNVYVHNHGFITENIKSRLGGKLNNFKNAIYTMHKETILITDLEEVLKKNLVKKSKFYFMHDVELNIFRNIMVFFIECLEETYVKDVVK